MSNKAISNVMSPAKLSLGTENKLHCHLFIFYCYFGETTWLENLGFFQVLVHILCLFLFFRPLFFRVSFSEELGCLTPMVSGECPSPAGSTESPRPQKRAGCAPARPSAPSCALAPAPSCPAGWGEEASEQLWGCWAEAAAGKLCSSVAVTINLISSLQNQRSPTLSLPKRNKRIICNFFPSCLLHFKESRVVTMQPTAGPHWVCTS